MSDPNSVARKKAKELLKKNMDVIVGNIYKRMDEKKMTQKDLAYEIESEPPHVNYILRKKKGITINVLGRIAIALDTTISDLAR